MAADRLTITADLNERLSQARGLLISDPAEAEAKISNLLMADPDYPPALRILAASLRRQGKAIEAAVVEHQAIEVSSQKPGHRAAAQALQSGDHSRAKLLLHGLLADDGTDVLALTILGLQAANATNYEIAEPMLRRAVALAPDEALTRVALAELLHQSKRPALTLAELDAIPSPAAEAEAIQSLRAEALSALGRLDEELEILERLSAAAAPDLVRYGIRIGHALRSLGRSDEAAATYRAITQQTPGEGTSWWSLANLKTVTFDDSDIAAMEASLARPKMPVQNSIRLNFALGKAFEDRQQAEAAFVHYAEGNRLRTTISSYDPQMISAWVDSNFALFTPAFFAARAGLGAAASDPIFIIGLQRSGSTLVEQVLASHPLIEGTAELNEIPTIVRQLGEAAASRNQGFQSFFPGLGGDRLKALGETYVETSQVYRMTDRPFFTDKMPNNWMHLGLIRTILPNARIIDVRRDPMSCCFSNWKQLYAQGLDHSNRLDSMGRFYVDYVRLMRHFDAVQPGAIHRVLYDDLVDDLEGEARRLLDYLGLPFDPVVLDFHSNKRAVRTISAGQVRRPINRDGFGQWQPFDQWLDPLKNALGDTLNNWRG